MRVRKVWGRANDATMGLSVNKVGMYTPRLGFPRMCPLTSVYVGTANMEGLVSGLRIGKGE